MDTPEKLIEQVRDYWTYKGAWGKGEDDQMVRRLVEALEESLALIESAKTIRTGYPEIDNLIRAALGESR
jgi:hypothetical protein